MRKKSLHPQVLAAWLDKVQLAAPERFSAGYSAPARTIPGSLTEGGAGVLVSITAFIKLEKLPWIMP